MDGTVLMLTDPFDHIHMGRTAEAVARKYGVSRAEQDEFANESQRRAAAAAAVFAEEITPVETGGRRPVGRGQGRAPEAGHDARGAGGPAAGVRGGRHRDGRQLLRHQRRCRGRWS